MHAANCPVLDREVRIDPQSVLSMHKTSEGVVTYYRCRCGALCVMLQTRSGSGHRVYHPESVVGDAPREPALAGIA
ncbi:MAG: hypothetical protein R3343_06005 [Nitriliruptorales bacterium]|nr:hypothetical protein [Nitriliruptorales bacterium]